MTLYTFGGPYGVRLTAAAPTEREARLMAWRALGAGECFEPDDWPLIASEPSR